MESGSKFAAVEIPRVAKAIGFYGVAAPALAHLAHSLTPRINHTHRQENRSALVAEGEAGFNVAAANAARNPA